MRQRIRNTIFILLKNTPVYRYIKTIKKKGYLSQLKSQEVPDIYSDPVITAINLNADDICNSRCTMCNIWKQKRRYEITPEDLETILKNPLFKHVGSVGVTGGEPTLRPDLSLLFEAIYKTLPNVTDTTIISNCIRDNEVIERVDEVLEVNKKYNKDFSMMISLDGVGEVHDLVRGKRGNFESAMKVLNYFRAKNVTLLTGSTISKLNVWDVDELLDFLKENKIYGRFRIAEFIKRIYNEDRGEVIRNFDKDETYHLILFFYKLIYTFEENELYIRTYKSIINILSGGERLIGCPYHLNGVVLDSRGDLSYCAPKSKIIGSTLTDGALDIYKNNLSEKERILKENCKDCIHDYPAPITYKEKMIEIDEIKWKNIITIHKEQKLSAFNHIKAKKNGKFQVFITGWYGTETVGDKAIIGQIIEEIYERWGIDSHIVISSLYPLITKRTAEELNLTNITVIPVYAEDFISYAKGSDVAIMGGGPLMDLDELALPLILFKIARKHNIKTIVYGCGLGPLVKEPCINAVKEILKLSDEIKLRDLKSVTLAQKWAPDAQNIEMTGDPGKRYIAKFIDKNKEKKNVLSCYLRELTSEYFGLKTNEEFVALKTEFEDNLAEFIKKKALELNVDSIYLDHMHNFIIGNDDRDFSRRFIKKYFTDFPIEISYNKKLSTIESIAHSMQTSAYNICMRFHSVVFAHTLETRFSAIDYTSGGKIFNYLKDNRSEDALVSIKYLIDKQ